MAIPPYSPQAFFRNVPHTLLARYFEQKQISLNLDWSTLEGPRKSAELIFQAITQLPEEIQAKTEVDFQNINALACDGGIYALNNEAWFAGNDTFREGMAEVDGLHAKSMWAFLQKESYWPAASSLLHAKNVSAGRWKKLAGLPAIPANVEPENIERLSRKIKYYFKNRVGKGRRCQVDVYRDMETNKEYFFAQPEDFGQIVSDWNKDTLEPRALHPAFEIIFVYSQEQGFIDIYAPKNSAHITELQRIFAKVVLGLDVLPDGQLSPTAYDLSPLSDKHLEFDIEDIPDLEDMYVTQLRLTLKNDRKRKIVLDVNDKNNPMATYELLDSMTTEHNNFPPYEITQTMIRVVIPATPTRKRSYKDERITPPYSCNLNHDGIDGIIRKVLTKVNIETAPTAPETEAAA